MNENRRGFLKRAGCTALGIGCGLPLLGTGCRSRHAAAAAESNDWAMIIDVRKCQDPDVRRKSAAACHRQHQVPQIDDPKREVKWIWEESYRDVFPDQAHAYTEAALKKTYRAHAADESLPVLVLCNHCSSPSCTKVCPTGATWKRADGLVMMDMHRCIGCRYCMAACPYGARSFNWRDARPEEYLPEDDEKPSINYPKRSKGVVEKCTFCAERIRAAEEGQPVVPACVEAANGVQPDAMAFGKLSDLKDQLEANHTICRRVGLGTGPNVYYIV